MSQASADANKTGKGLVGVLMAIVALSSVGAITIGLGSDNPRRPDDCLPVQAAAAAAPAGGGGALQSAADEAVGAGRRQGIDVGVVIADAAKPQDTITAGKTDLMPSASVIKLAVAVTAAKKVDAGAVSMESVTPLLNPMISVSDNNATNQLVALLGGASQVNATIASLGVTPGDAVLGRELGVPVSGPDPNVLSAPGAAKLLQIIYDSDHQTGSPATRFSKSSAEPIVAAMRAQQVNTKFGAVLPHNDIAHKTGELTGTSHDVGWFFSGQRWLSVSILTNKPGGADQTAGNEIIKTFAKKVFDARDQPVTGGTGNNSPPASASTSAAPSSPAPAPAGGHTMPLKDGTYQVSSGFGPRGGQMHQGVDFAAPLGTPIYAAAAGTVAKAGPADGFGNWVIVDFDDNGTKTSNVYGHMRAADITVKAGDRVTAGQQIAKVGSEGESSGPHLHFEVWPGTRLGGGHAIDPMPWLRGATQPTGATTPNIVNAAVVTPGTGCGQTAVGGSTLKPGSVPAAFEPWIIKAGGTCPEITAPIIAAQLENESGFNVNAHNDGSGADGPSQFLPATWAAKAVDGDGDGRKDPRSIPDAVMTQAAYDCELAGIMRDALKQGKVHGDLLELTLSAYNCGPGATLSQGGPCQNTQTQGYITKIPERARTVFAAPAANAEGTLPAGGVGGRIVAAAMRWQGTTYAWGGGTPRGPSPGIRDFGVADSFGDFNKIGFDCSGLVLYAVYQATNGKIELAHYTVTQLNDPRGKPIPRDQIQPGDILFPGGGNPQHVVIYIGGGKVVEAPQSGDVVKVSPVSGAVGNNFDARRFG
ncbi:peptidoglycan DD-metalloendopeptidase family protein [Gordonia sp. N1V]|uniref:peptidoglycan DD-metalloendopeptidase family protein n=1 Tax=Gordonia sp. N1V TaxID=3034163 RepID=UPI0023E340C3|nr:peptidoglycan DD-metalloendopeptidase family protein [Gordonia sp. N1V]MDF3285040.1 peptidoglycan DD-metalloendopeptidase family protein [Gordonia sp. N1V]